MPKVCSKCGIEKPLKSFTKDNRRPTGYSGICKTCNNTNSKESRNTRPEKYRASDKARGVLNREKNMAIIKELTGLKCSNCSFSHSSTAPFDWHHIDPLTKENEIGNLMRRATPDALLKEIEKCVFLCKNCHAIEHERLRRERDEFIKSK